MAYSGGIDAITQVLSFLAVSLVIWLCIRALRFARFRQLLTVVGDAADSAAVVTSATGRRLRLDTKRADVATSGWVADNYRSSVRVVALKGQRVDLLQPGTIVKLYGRLKNAGSALVTDGETVIIGRGKRRAGAQAITDTLERH